MPIEQYNTSKQRYENLRKSFANKSSTKIFSIEYLVDKFQKGQIHTDLDIQRDYQWDEPRKQELFHTLIVGTHIPEFHSLIEGIDFNILDGKQRFLTIVAIVTDQCRLKRSVNNQCEELLWLFCDETTGQPVKNSLAFSELPKNIQYNILNTELLVTTYTDYTTEEQAMLFKKINNGKQISAFAKGISENFQIRKSGTVEIFKFPFYAAAGRDKLTEEVEQSLVRYMILSDNGIVSLDSKILSSYYKNFLNNNRLNNICLNAKTLFNRLTEAKITLDMITSRCRSWNSYAPVLYYYLELHPNIAGAKLQQFFALNGPYTQLSRPTGTHLSAREVADRYHDIDIAFKNL